MTNWASGATTEIGFAKGSAWATAVVLASASKRLWRSESISLGVETVADPSVTGEALAAPGDAGNVTVDGQTEHTYYTDNFDLLIALCLGGVYAKTGSAPNITHKYKVRRSADGLFATLALRKTFEVWEIPSAKVQAIEFSIDPKESLLKMAVTWMGNNMARNTSGGSNNNTSWASTTFATTGNTLRFADCKVYLDDMTAGGALPELCVSNISYRFERPMEGDRTTCQAGALEEPLLTDFFKVSGSLLVPAYSDATDDVLGKAEAKTKQRLKIAFSRVVGSTTFKHEVWVPCCTLTNKGPNASGPGKMPMTLDWEAGTAPAAVTGFAHTVPYIVNQDATDSDVFTANET